VDVTLSDILRSSNIIARCLPDRGNAQRAFGNHRDTGSGQGQSGESPAIDCVDLTRDKRGVV